MPSLKEVKFMYKRMISTMAMIKLFKMMKLVGEDMDEFSHIPPDLHRRFILIHVDPRYLSLE